MTLNENGGLVRRLSNSPLWLPSSAPFSETPNLYVQLPSLFNTRGCPLQLSIDQTASLFLIYTPSYPHSPL
ncbi:hypothetical protein PGT21_027139 [Puccinia graminis f. sp. tritici]|uniref:Uncharacterized protein n=1 Tax=Puccinia graminis f. sp. tritici TaxID=56615 RepID=A0A5B0RSW1_PUCGR|nr:hypothetical protein PGT21_027139 [Puccinia graminis f. sp. tritici]KAA1095736.1 hypothetical protein PGTUg99_027502 [Puccinia graminis f. sp. tritici]KAA1128412.1 hypothetical protein PGTUg99_022702 [Puccinia graminis f. sp. tritici]KAA1137125.1 hypothetical protein PGTUg99_014988 [Puccinia graminis f. sp. tritici]